MVKHQNMTDFVRSLEFQIFLDFLDSIELETNEKNKKCFLLLKGHIYSDNSMINQSQGFL